MEFKGNEFIRNIEIEKEKVDLQKQADALEAKKNKSVINSGYSDVNLESPQYFQKNSSQSNINNEPVVLDIQKDSLTQDLDDILLANNPEANSANKKKYIVLSIALIILFVLTITIIQLISKDTEENRLFVKPNVEKTKQNTILSDSDSNIKYQQLIDKKTKKTIQKKLDLDSIAKKEIPLPKEKTTEKEKIITKKIKKTTTDIFGMEQKENVIKKSIQIQVPKPIKKEVLKKKIIKPTTPTKPIKKETIKSPKKITKIIPKTVSKKIIGTFVQVGAFTQQPSTTLLNKIKKYGYTYTIVQMTIKGKLYNKVLIGPYSNKQKTVIALKKIKKDLNNKNAYILKLK